MLPIYVMYDSGINELEEQAIHDALYEITNLLGINIQCLGSEPWGKESSSSIDWYIQNTEVVYGLPMCPQLNADDFINLLANGPWQAAEPHIDIVITSHDLTAFDAGEQLGFVFGLSNERVAVQSIARYRWFLECERYLVIKTVIWHQIGHIFGAAANPERSNLEYSLGWHCTNPGCSMQQGLMTEEWVKHAQEVRREGRIYCSQCMAELTVVL